MMRLQILLFLVVPGGVVANEMMLSNDKNHTVPEGKVWIIQDAPVSECRVCTSDVYVKGEMSQVEISGVVFNGSFEFSFSSNTNGVIKLYPGTEIWLGDSRPSLIVNEQEQ